ncbi:MAG: phosphoribosyltransferase family protein [Frankiaceae bacterium]
MTGGWLAAALGLHIDIVEDVTGEGLDALAGLALRRNPRRAHLLVSRVLAKHVPVRPRVALAAAGRLAGQVPDALLAGGAAPLVIGYAETATGLGHALADALGGRHPDTAYLHSTRRVPPGWPPALAFEEEHSHATTHRLLPVDPRLLTRPRPVVLVDDELSTGRTAANTIRALHRLAPHPAYVVAGLIDLRPSAARLALDELAAELGVPIVAVALVRGGLAVPADIAERAGAVLRAAGPLAGAPRLVHGPARVPVAELRPSWPAELPDGARHGWGAVQRGLLDATLPALADRIAGRLTGGPCLVLGTEELMYLPLRLAALLDQRVPAAVRVQSTTRSPVTPLDRDGYAVRSALAFDAAGEPGRVSYLYNLAPGPARSGDPDDRDDPYDPDDPDSPDDFAGSPYDIVLVTDAPPGPSLLAALSASARRGVHVLRVPANAPSAIPAGSAA